MYLIYLEILSSTLSFLTHKATSTFSLLVVAWVIARNGPAKMTGALLNHLPFRYDVFSRKYHFSTLTTISSNIPNGSLMDASPSCRSKNMVSTSPNLNLSHKAFSRRFTLALESNKDVENFVLPMSHLIKGALGSFYLIEFHSTL